MVNRVASVAAAMAALLVGSACTNQPTAPTEFKVFQLPADPNSGASVGGVVYVHSADGMSVAAGARIFGWIENANGSGATTGPIVTGDDGSYRIIPGINATRLRIGAMSSGLYQPCAVTVNSAAGGGTQDIHLISDLSLLGANLPEIFMAQGSLLSGSVYEMTGAGRQPLANASIQLDAADGNGVLIASTLTDAEGRFVLCGVSASPSLYLFAAKDGYELWGRGQLDGVANLEIELRSK